MGPIHVLDKYYLAITVLVTVGYQLSGFAIAWTLQFDKITDFTGGSNFFILALLTLILGQSFHARNIVASTLVMVWATRMAGFLLFRVLRRGRDARFDDIRSHFFKFLGFWVAQILWVWTVSLPVIILNSPSVNDAAPASHPGFGTSRDIAGILLWALGWVVESVADAQKYYYRARCGAPADRPFTRGIWKWSRHPPYFGEMVCWWGIWILCLSPTTNGTVPSTTRSALYGSIASPLFTTFVLLFGSGIPTAEKPTGKKFYLMSHGPTTSSSDPDAWRIYQAYLERTSILIPLPPVLYRHIPRVIKRSLLLDFPMYQFHESKDEDAAVKEAAGNLDG